MRSHHFLALTIAVAFLRQGSAFGANEYVYRLDGVAEMPIHVEGTTAVVDMPSINEGPGRLEQQVGFRPQRYIYDAKLHRLIMLDLVRKKMFVEKLDEMVMIKKAFLQRYWDSKQKEIAALAPADRAKVERLRDDKLAHPAAVTTFGVSKGRRPGGVDPVCEEVDYATDGKLGGTACAVPWAELSKHTDGPAAIKEAEAVFGVLASLELFNIQIDTAAAPGLIADLKTVAGRNAHSLLLLRVRKIADKPELLETNGFSALLKP